MQSMWRDLRQDVNRFFFIRETPFGLALARIMLPLVVLSMVWPRWFHARELYSADGATAQLALGYGYANFMPEFSGEWAVALYSVLVAALLCVCVGWRTRTSLVVSLVLYTYFSLLDAISTMTKYSVITTHMLLLLSCSHCGALWSVDAWLARSSGPRINPLPPEFDVWPRRLMQLLIGIIYFGAATTKINTPAFFSGDQLQMWMLTHINFRHPLGEFFALYPLMLKVMSYTCFVWEIVFIFLVWNQRWRPLILAVGILFHFMTTLTLGLIIFPMTCYVVYLTFIEEEDFLWLRQSLRRSRALPVAWSAATAQLQNSATAWLPNPAGWQRHSGWSFGMLMLLLATGGVAAEYQLDPFGLRRPEGPYELVPLDPEFAAKLTAPPEPLRDEDKFFAVDTGTLLVGDMLADRRRVFRQGDKLITQCHLVPPHEDMWIECRILDAHNRIVHRSGNVAMRESFRLNFDYPITTAVEPGDYSVVITTAGREIQRKRISIVGNGSTMAAN